MDDEIKLTKFFTTPARELFNYFIDPSLIEKWAYPDGMSLKVPKFEARVGGKYRYEYTNEKGSFLCEGHVERIVPQESIKMVDEWIKAPDEKLIGQNLSCNITFKSLGDGCNVMISQSGFETSDFARECEEGWTQSLDHLQELTQSSKADERQSSLTQSGPRIDRMF